MPAANPLVAEPTTASSTSAYGQTAPAQQSQLGTSPMRAAGLGPSSINAAGTSENIAMHVAIIAALALIGVFILRESGFKFVVAGGAR